MRARGGGAAARTSPDPQGVYAAREPSIHSQPSRPSRVSPIHTDLWPHWFAGIFAAETTAFAAASSCAVLIVARLRPMPLQVALAELKLTFLFTNVYVTCLAESDRDEPAPPPSGASSPPAKAPITDAATSATKRARSS